MVSIHEKNQQVASMSMINRLYKCRRRECNQVCILMKVRSRKRILVIVEANREGNALVI